MEKYLEAPWLKARTTYPVWVLKTWSPGAEQGVAADNRLLQWRKDEDGLRTEDPLERWLWPLERLRLIPKSSASTLERSLGRSSGVALSWRPARAGEIPARAVAKDSRSEDQTARAVPRPLERPVSRLTPKSSPSLGLSFGLIFNPRFLLSLLVFISF